MKFSDRLVRWLDSAARRPSVLESPRVRLIATLLAVAVFLGGGAVAIAHRPDLLHNVDFAAWLLVWACVPLTVVANSAQFWLMGRLTRTSLTPIRATLITLISTAANMLPLPGGSLVRIAALKTADNSYRSTGLVTILTAGCRIGVALMAAGIALLLLAFPGLGITSLAAGLAASVTAALALRLTLHASPRWLTAVGSLQFLLIGIGALRLWLCFQALGNPANALDVIVLTVAGVTSTVIGIAPAGFGIAEATAAGIALIIGVSATAAFLAEALNRITGMIFVGPLAALINQFDRGVPSAQSRRASDEPRNRF